MDDDLGSVWYNEKDLTKSVQGNLAGPPTRPGPKKALMHGVYIYIHTHVYIYMYMYIYMEI